MCDLVAAFRGAVAQLVGIGGEFYFDIKTALGIEAFRLRRKHRQVLHARKHDDGKLGIFGSPMLRREEKNEPRQRGQQTSHHIVLPIVIIDSVTS
jgi:hypothetical protein